MTDTLAYYDQHAVTFFAQTANVDMSALQERFLSHIQPGGYVLDAGCGSGRDAKAFLARGYRVAAFDASPRLAQLASEYIGQAVAVHGFTDVAELGCYDGIWACARPQASMIVKTKSARVCSAAALMSLTERYLESSAWGAMSMGR
ncbi:MAG: class I SAM-dependent methyltransferase [Gammaproteobacteria bacterium]|nr:class I SAM-dependent methyltransferase [Gammaproteobacteria bacterium]